ncbi:hypothetical protein [Deinococcus hopiensis]|uniref:Uncharacterized protein n=1 Tax=Deinococcus hopiensis KR-140 TaxID=695939 RepID=A0A1W1UK94_9DEIO|nr:hypothetical protein [Deinococcus hopiensis]SMB81459.1 hypothetical protein SAMN00790413_04588 [Deinococcus hopiensis KR-140]
MKFGAAEMAAGVGGGKLDLGDAKDVQVHGGVAADQLSPNLAGAFSVTGAASVTMPAGQ